MSDATLLTEGQGTPSAAAPAEAAASPAAGDPPAEGAPAAETPAPAEDGGQPSPNGDTPKPGEGEAPKDGEGKKPEDEKKPEKNPNHGAPEGDKDYEDFKPEEGADEFNADLVKEAKTIAKKLDLSQEGAAELNRAAHEMAKSMAAAQLDVLQTARQEWQAAVKADPEIGGTKLKENLATASKALEAFGDADFKTMLEKSGLGDNPAMVRFAFKIGKAMSDDSMVVGRPTPHDNRTRAERMYPNQPK